MGKFFFYAVLLLLIVVFLLFLPFFFSVKSYFDLKSKKVAFSVYFFDLLKVFGGYATLYKQGFAFHVKKNKAILLPFNEMGEESKKFSFTKCFKRTKTFVFTHSGAEHLFLAAPFHALISAYFMRKNSNMEEKSLLYLTNGDELRVCTTVEFYFNFFLLLREGLTTLKEKLKENGRKKRKN